MIGAYVAGSSALHRAPFGLKLAAMLVLSLVVVPLTDWRVLALLLAAVVGLYAALGRTMLSRLALLRPLWPMLLGIGLLQGVLESWPLAAAAILRILLMVAAASLITFTTTLAEMLDTLTPAFRPLARFGVNPRAPALAIALVMRLVPLLLALWQEREEAWRARTGRRASVRLIPSFVAQALRLSDQMAEALEARGFSPTAAPPARPPASPPTPPSGFPR